MVRDLAVLDIEAFEGQLAAKKGGPRRPVVAIKNEAVPFLAALLQDATVQSVVGMYKDILERFDVEDDDE